MTYLHISMTVLGFQAEFHWIQVDPNALTTTVTTPVAGSMCILLNITYTFLPLPSPFPIEYARLDILVGHVHLENYF